MSEETEAVTAAASPAPKGRDRDVWRVVGTNAVSKIAVLGLSGVIGFITTRLIIQHFGVADYAQYGLLNSMSSLVPFADLGMSAAIINAVAVSADPRTDDVVRRTLLSAFRVLLASFAVLAAIGVALTVAGVWPAVLGEGLQQGGSLAALLCVLIFGATLPLGVGQRILTGLGRNHIQVRTSAIAAPLTAVLIVAAIVFEVPAGNFLAVAPYLGVGVVAGTALWLAARYIRPQVARAVRDVPRVRTVPGTKIMNVAWPMLAQMLALPIAMQTDRLLLSHIGTTAQLSQYNLASQLFGLITATISSAGIALWPFFAKARAGRRTHSPWRLAVGFAGGGLVMAAVLGAIMPWVTPIVSDGKIRLDVWLIVGFIAFVTAQAAKYPLGMYMTDFRGLRFQVAPIIVMVPVNLGLSWALIGPVGAAGPIIGSAIAVTLCQVVPNVVYVRRDLTRRRAEPVRD